MTLFFLSLTIFLGITIIIQRTSINNRLLPSNLIITWTLLERTKERRDAGKGQRSDSSVSLWAYLLIIIAKGAAKKSLIFLQGMSYRVLIGLVKQILIRRRGKEKRKGRESRAVFYVIERVKGIPKKLLTLYLLYLISTNKVSLKN